MSEHTSPSRTPGWLAPAALVLAVIAVALAAWSALRSPAQDPAAAPTNSSASTAPTSANPADAKTQVCQAFDLVRNAVSLQTNANLGPDPAATQAVAANARLATLGGGQFLLTRLDGASADLTDAVRSFATDLQYIGMGQLAGARGDDPTQKQRTDSAQATANRITDLCK
jgi:hypothetical protein